MASPQFGVPVILQTGNASSITAPPGPPVIDSRVFTNFGSSLPAPSMSRSVRMPTIERITPRSMNATRALHNRAANVRVALAHGRKRVLDTVKGYGGSAVARSGADPVIMGRRVASKLQGKPSSTTATHVR